jgi:hypothetical protein
MLRDLGRAYLNLPCGEIATGQRGHARVGRGRVQHTVVESACVCGEGPIFSVSTFRSDG